LSGQRTLDASNKIMTMVEGIMAAVEGISMYIW
jgi:hypothetical protein